MPIHDWTRVSAGTFHALNTAWLGELQRSLNNGVLPTGFYALAEQVASDVGPDVLALRVPDESDDSSSEDDRGSVAVATAAPRTAVQSTLELESAFLATRRRHLVIRHASGDDAVALIELVSPGNKSGKKAVDDFVSKAISALKENLHVQIIDLFPPGRSDPGGLHQILWQEMGGVIEDGDFPANRPLTLAAYAAGPRYNCYVEPTAVGLQLIDLPLFLKPERYVNVPLEQTYMAAYEGLPRRWKNVIEAA